MGDFIVTAQKLYQWANDVADPRVKNWLLLTSLWPVVVINLLYLLVVWYGPRLMKSKEPFSLKHVLIVYNLGSVGLACYIFYEILDTAILSKYSFPCQPVDYSADALPVRMARAFNLHLIARIIEMLDTVFFILRKKNSQVTFLHVYHHFSMIINAYLGARYIPGGNAAFYILLNSMVHIFMYTYYGLAAFGPSMQKYLFWKRYLTKLQLAQFFAFLGHTAYIIYVDVDCRFPRYYTKHMHIYSITLAVLFSNFYYQAYMSNAKKKQT